MTRQDQRANSRVRMLAFLVGLGLLAAACGPAAAPQPAADQPVEIELWHRFGGAHQKVLQEVIAAFQSQNPRITVKEESVGGQYIELVQKVAARVAARQDPPTMILSGYNFFEHVVNEFGAIPIEDVGGSEAREVLDRYKPQLLQLGQLGGKQYGLPLAISVPVLYYDEDDLKAAGIAAPPQTWTEVEQAATKIKAGSAKSPVFLSNADTWLMQALIESAGGVMLGSDGCTGFNTPDGVKAMEMWQRFHQSGLTPKATYQEAGSAFVAGQMDMFATSIMDYGNWSQQAKFPLKTSTFPTFEGKPLRVPTGGAAMVFLSKDVAKQRAGWAFAKYITSKEGITTWVKTAYLSPLKVDVPVTDAQKPAYAVLEHAVRWVNWPGPNGLEIERRLTSWRDKIIYGETSAKDGLEAAAKEVNGLLPNCK